MAAGRPDGVRWELPGDPTLPVSMLLRKEDVEMRTEFDFSPLFRSSVGFDRMFDLLQHATRRGRRELPAL